MIATETWLTPPQIAEMLGVDPNKVRQWIIAGELAASDVSAKAGGIPRWRVRPADLEAFLSRRAAHAPPPPKRRRRRKKTDEADVVERY